MMDNLLIQKVWNDDFVMEFRIVGISHYVSAHQDCYLDMKCVENTSELLNEVCNGSIKECYIVWGIKEGPYTPAFSFHMKSVQRIPVNRILQFSDYTDGPSVPELYRM